MTGLMEMPDVLMVFESHRMQLSKLISGMYRICAFHCTYSNLKTKHTVKLHLLVKTCMLKWSGEECANVCNLL